jgi:type I restriction enzyme, S subunit
MTEGGDRDKLGRGTIWRGEVVNCIHQNHIFRVRPDCTRLLPEYLSLYVATPDAKTYFLRAAKQTTGIASINSTQLSEFPVAVPPLHEQLRIASILDKGNATRRKREEGIRLNEELLRSTFLDMFGDPATNPKGWEFAPLSHFIRSDDKINYGIVQPGDDYSGGVPIVRVGDFSGRFVDVESLKRVNPSIDELHRRSRLVGDEVLLACVGSIGRVALADERLTERLQHCPSHCSNSLWR